MKKISLTTKGRIISAIILVLMFTIGFLNKGCSQSEAFMDAGGQVLIEDCEKDCEMPMGEDDVQLFIIMPNGGLAELPAGADIQDAAFNEYISILDATEELRNHAEDYIHSECRGRMDPDDPWYPHYGRSNEIYCILTKSIAMKRITGTIEQLAEDMYYEERPALDIDTDFKVLRGLMEKHVDSNGFHIWTEVRDNWNLYLAGEEYDG